MPLYFDCGNGAHPASFARKELNADAYLFCPGPSLAETVKNVKIKRPGVFSFAVNTAYPLVRPDVWVCLDRPECYDRRVWWEPFIKIIRDCRRNYTVAGQPIKYAPQTYWATFKDPVPMEYIFEARAHDAPIAWFKNVMGTVLHLMVWMGAKKIHFVGCDMGGEKDYHDERELKKVDREENQQLYKKLAGPYMESFTRLGKKYGVECISCTPGSPINAHMDFLPLRKALTASRRKAPRHGGEILNCREVNRRELLIWEEKSDFPAGFTTAVDANLDWCLKRWWRQLRRWSQKPVAIADLGMTPEMRAWAQQRMIVLDWSGTVLQPDSDKRVAGVEHGWKPFAFLKSPFELNCFLDIDVDIHGDIDSIFTTLPAGRKFAIVPDSLYETVKESANLEYGEVMHNSGVVLVRKKSRIVEQWASAVLDGPDDWRKNDQPILSKVLLNNPGLFTKLPMKYNHLWPGSNPPPPGAIGVHRLTSHPASRTFLREQADEMYCVDGLWIRDAAVMEKCRWASEPMADKGVIIGVDKNQQWMLEWWGRNYLRFNKYPVLIVDFGLTAHGRQLAESLGFALTQDVVELEARGNFKEAFKKPLGCLRTPFFQTIWLDTDTEVNGDLAPIFEHSERGRVGVTIDRGTPQRFKDAMPADAVIYNSGCVSYLHGDELIQKWAMTTVLTCMLDPQPGKLLCPCGDQETLALAIRKYAKHRISAIPKEQVSLRLGGDPDECLIKHWTGRDGKKVIKAKMQAGLAAGAMLKTDIVDFLKALPKGGTVAEIGVERGKTSKLIYEHTNPHKLHLVDLWRPQEIKVYNDPANVMPVQHRRNQEQVREELGSLPGVNIHPMSSIAFACWCPDAYFDWVYLDANHSLEAVAADLRAFAPKVKMGGFVCGHDYYCQNSTFKVKEAVDAFCRQFEWDIFMVTEEKWASWAIRRRKQ